MKVEVAPLREEHFPGLHAAFDAVAREKRYLAFLQAPPLEETFAFYRNILEFDSPHFIALAEGRVVGWCDVLPSRGESRAHVGVLGVALLPEFRGCGVGAALMRSAIGKAWDKGSTRIELSVRADNLRAISLYQRLGFEVEGTHRRASRIDGQYFDKLSMALLRA